MIEGKEELTPEPCVTEQALAHWEHRHEAGYQREVNPLFADFLEKHKKEIGPEVLDVGCGAGRNLLPMAREGYKVTGLDIVSGALKETARKLELEGLKAELAQGNTHDLPFTEGQFDTVVSHQVFQFNDWAGAEKCMAEAARVLKPGGLFFLRVRSEARGLPEECEILEDRGITFKMKKGGDTLTYHHYSLEEIEELADKNDLEIIEDPIDARKTKEDGTPEPGQWNVV
ncbi:methyltransferase domain-containing protein, partial [Patescibacteria group bacterium]|nr:methyltransferase domain-containing protein [Patescibacteria group bacterium]